MMYDIPTDGCNMEIMGYPFFAETVSPNESFRRREYNFNNIVGGTMKVTPGAYVGLDFSVTTHVYVDPERPDIHNGIFQEMMSKPVEVISPELGGRFNAIVIVKPEHEKLDYLKVTFSIKEIPDSQSLIVGEEYSVPASREVKVAESKTTSSTSNNLWASTSNWVTINNSSNLLQKFQGTSSLSKISSVAKKNKGSE